MTIHVHVRIHMYIQEILSTVSVHFRISLKRGQMPNAKIKGGEYKSKGGQPHIKDRESQLLRGGGPKALPAPPPPPPPEINPAQ